MSGGSALIPCPPQTVDAMKSKSWLGGGGKRDKAPPVYEEFEVPHFAEDAETQLREAFYHLNLCQEPSAIPTIDTCLAHLRLLRAFEDLKTRVGYSDGLWDIWDTRAHNASRNAADDVLAKLREKRWAVFVARAAERYEAWWKSFVPDMLTESDMLTDGKDGQLSKYESFVTRREPMIWTSDALPPLGENDEPLPHGPLLIEASGRRASDLACAHAKPPGLLGGLPALGLRASVA